MVNVVGMLEFIREHFVSLVFAIMFVFGLVWLIRMNIGNGDYHRFRLAHLFMRADGTLDRKGFRDTVLFFVSVYGFVFIIQKHPDSSIEYLLALTGVWGVYHVANDKLPTLSHAPREDSKEVK